MLIRRAELIGGAIADIRVTGGRIAAIGVLPDLPGEAVIDAKGGLLLPGLHDHHIHVASLSAAQNSVKCGPPEVIGVADLAAALHVPGLGWLRGMGYHESVAGMLDAATLDRLCPERPLRIQHRSGRMWFLNSMALSLLLEKHAPPPGLERNGANFTGRLFDEDNWLRGALAGSPPCFAKIGAELARYGVTGLTDMSPANDAVMARHFAAEQARGAMPQKLFLAGRIDLTEADMAPGITLDAAKLHLHDADLPDFDDAAAFIAKTHARGRPVAVHCVTETELVFTQAAFAEAGVVAGDRIEHASVAPDFAVGEMARLGLAVVAQPHFIVERGDAYRADIAADLQPFLYRLKSFIDEGVVLAAGSDAPFGGVNPWLSMQAAVTRRTRAGVVMGAAEALSPAQALKLYLCAPKNLSRQREVAVGAPADLCLLDRGWARARLALDKVRVRATWIDGRQILDGIDEAPV
jgi:predicted amidohydrolase YtcJ